MIYWHRAELTALTPYAAMQLKQLTMCCWLHAHSLAGHFVHWRMGRPCREGRAAAAACNMWLEHLPGSPPCIFHYSLFNLSPCCHTAVQSLKTFSSCRESLCPFYFPERIPLVYSTAGKWTLQGWKMGRLNSAPDCLNCCSVQVKFAAAVLNNHLWHQIPTDKILQSEQPQPASHQNIPTVMKVWMERGFFWVSFLIPINMSANLHTICQRLFEQQIVQGLS